MIRTCIDYETRSEANLKKVGAISYAQHPSTEIMCVGYKIGDAKSKIWLPWKNPMPAELMAEFHDRTPARLLAHNALFEQAITNFVLTRYEDIPKPRPQDWKCSAAKAAVCALPRSLEGSGAALRLPVQKNVAANRLLQKHMKPRPQWTKHRKGEKYFEDEWEREVIYHYCRTDVDVACLVDDALPDLTPFEREVWLLNQETNLRGIHVDVPTVNRIMCWIGQETKRMNRELHRLTGGRVRTANQRDEFLRWVRDQDCTIGNLQADTVTRLLQVLEETKGSTKVIRALQIRQSLGKSSIKKYPAMLQRVSKDGTVKDNTLYHGASTGRDTGRGLQIHNLVKGKIKNTDLAIEVLNTSTLDEIRFIYGDPFEVFSSCVRGMVKASPGHELYAADYSAIEARVLQWLAGDRAGLKRFRNREDSYVLMASKIFGKPIEKVTKDEREVGKRAELGCGFQMGGTKFYETCLKYGATNVTEELCKRAVQIFRKTHPEVEQMWKNLELAACRAVRKPGRVIKVNKTAWQLQDGFLWCQLPSGRRIAYREPTVRFEETPWGEEAPKLYHWGENPKTHKWEDAATYGGRLTENVVQAVARDIMVAATLRCEKAGFRYLFSVHDEVICEREVGRDWLPEYERVIMTLPAWAGGLPITAKGWRGPRYKKA